ncbi:hypothetical protein ACWGJT_19870, partial [Streptomyces xantholiticus]
MPFEDDLGAAMRRTGETFRPSDRPGLVDGGLIRGRPRPAPRRGGARARPVRARATGAGVGGE